MPKMLCPLELENQRAVAVDGAKGMKFIFFLLWTIAAQSVAVFNLRQGIYWDGITFQIVSIVTACVVAKEIGRL